MNKKAPTPQQITDHHTGLLSFD